MPLSPNRIRFSRRLACLLVLPVLLVSLEAAMAQRPAPIAIPEDLLDGELLPTHKRQITDRINWWAKSILTARTEKEVISARKGWEEDYRYYQSSNYRVNFAGLSVPKGLALLNGTDLKQDDPLAVLKQINVAMAFSQMQHLSAVEAMEQMVAHKNAAIRFLGWKAYRGTRGVLLKGGKAGVNKFLAALGKAMLTETNPMVSASVLAAMNLSDVDLSATTKQTLQKQFVDQIQIAWDTYRRSTLDGKLEWIRAVRNGVQTLGIIGSERALSKTCLQLLANLADSTSRTYAKAIKNRDQAAETGDAKLEKQNGNLADACKTLLLDIEGSLRLISGVIKKPIQHALTAPAADVPDRGAAAQTAVLDWVDDLESAGVVEPPDPKKPAKPAK